MEEPREIEEAEEDDLDTDETGGDDPGPRSLATAEHIANVDAETAFLTGLLPAERRSVLREVVAGSRNVVAESLVRLSIVAHEAGDRPLLNLTFEALSKTATPLLLSQAWNLPGEDRKDQAQEILLQLFGAIREGNAEMAGRVFAAWAKRRSISLYRKRTARFEGSAERIEPTNDHDPLDEIAERIPSPEAKAMLSRAIQKLPQKHAVAFIRVHVFGMTQEEVAKQMKVNVRTLREWLKMTAEVLGHDGDEDDH